MSIQARAARVLGDDAVQRIAHVRPDVGVVVLVQAERAAGVLDEQREQADAVVRELGQRGCDLGRDEVGAARARAEGERFLEPGGFGHGWLVGWLGGGWWGWWGCDVGCWVLGVGRWK